MNEKVIGYRENFKLSEEDLLHNLVAKQQSKVESTQPLGFDVSSRRAIFAWFKTTNDFRLAYRELVRYCLMPRTNDEINMLRDNFAGRLYQDMTYAVLANRQSKLGGVFLSSESTLELYKGLYPYARLSQNPFGLGALGSISVPDGVVIGKDHGKEKVIAVCQYTLSGRRERFENIYSGFQIHKMSFPGIFAKGAYLLFVVPEKGGLLREKRKDLHFDVMPFNHTQFRDFINGIYNFYTPDGDAGTVNDVLAWGREQYGRLLRLGNRGSPLTQENREFLSRVKNAFAKESNLALAQRRRYNGFSSHI